MKQFERSPIEGFETFMSLKKVAFFDIGLIVDALIFERERIIRQQQEAIRELSTPVLQIRERLLLLPIIGVIDTHRARLITESLLQSIRDNRAKVVVMDVTGVATIDSKVANHLLQTVTAARLMGAMVIVTGLSADVAQSLVALGIELDQAQHRRRPARRHGGSRANPRISRQSGSRTPTPRLSPSTGSWRRGGARSSSRATSSSRRSRRRSRTRTWWSSGTSSPNAWGGFGSGAWSST